MTGTAVALHAWLLVLIAAGAAPAARAQTAMPLTLDEARARAVAKVPDVAVQRDVVRLAIEAERRAAAVFDPIVRVDSRLRSRTDPLNTLFSGAPDGAFGPRTTGLTASASWSALLTSGGTVTALASTSVDRTNSLFALLTPAYQAAAGIEFRQPLARGRRTDAARQRLRLTSADTTRTHAQLRQVVTDVVASVFPIGGMPLPFQSLSRIIPARYFIEVVRGIVLRGAGLNELWVPVGWLAFYASAIIGLAVLRFKKTA